jgi:hypothetical protein
VSNRPPNKAQAVGIACGTRRFKAALDDAHTEIAALRHPCVTSPMHVLTASIEHCCTQLLLHPVNSLPLNVVQGPETKGVCAAAHCGQVAHVIGRFQDREHLRGVHDTTP